MQEVLDHLANAREDLETEDADAKELHDDIETLERRARATLATRALGEQAGAHRAVIEDTGQTVKLAVYVTDLSEFTDALITTNSIEDTKDSTEESQSEEAAGESGDDAQDDPKWCGRCGEQKPTENGVKIHNGHKHEGEAIVLDEEPDPSDLEEDTESDSNTNSDAEETIEELNDHDDSPVQGQKDDQQNPEQTTPDDEDVDDSTDSSPDDSATTDSDDGEENLADRWPSAVDVAEQRADDEKERDEELLDDLPDYLPSVAEIRSAAEQPGIRTLEGFAEELGIQDKSIARIVAMRLDLYDKELDRPEGSPNPSTAGGDD